jgi:tetratricopeptide (TPR) repeat protein
LGWLLFSAGRYGAALLAAERAAALARAGGDDLTLALAEESRVNHLQMLGRLDDALRVGREVLPLAERLGDLECLWRLHNDLAYTHVLRADFASARGAFDRALALAEQQGNPALIAFGLAMRSWVAVLSGEWASARADLDRAAAVGSRTDRTTFSAYLPIFPARLSLAEGAWDAAAAQARDALALSEWGGDLQALRWASGVLAELEIREGRPGAAVARLVPLLDRPGLEECDATMLLPVLAWAQLELGQADLAADAVEQAVRRARPEGMRVVLVEALWVRALVALRRGQREEAARGMAEGLALARAMPYPYAEGRLLHAYGTLHLQVHERAPARECLEAALAIFRRLGARKESEQIEQILAALG